MGWSGVIINIYIKHAALVKMKENKALAFKLNIPLERKNYLPYWIISGCIAFTAIAAFFSTDFAIVFIASSR